MADQIALAPGERIVLYRFLEQSSPKVKGFKEVRQRTQLRRALGISETDIAVTTRRFGDQAVEVLQLGKLHKEPDGPRWVDLKKGREQLFSLSAELADYLLKLLRSETVDVESRDAETLVNVEERVSALRDGSYVAPEGMPSWPAGDEYETEENPDAAPIERAAE